MKKRMFMKNGAIMAATALLIRIIAMFSGIYLSDTIGSEGMGLYRLILSVYFFFASAVSTGFSLTTTRLVTDFLSLGNKAQAKFAAEKCMLIAAAAGMMTGILMFLSADYVGIHFLDDTRTVQAMKILSLSLPFMAFSACVRGYFTARRKTLQGSGEQLLEQVIEIAVFVVIMNVFRPDSLSAACNAAVIGTVSAELLSFFYALALYVVDVRQLAAKSEHIGGLYRKMMPVALPVSANSCLRSGLSAIENMLIPFGLKRCGSNSSDALSQYGTLSGMTMPVLTFPAVLILPFSMLIIPEMAEANIRKHQKSIGHMTAKMLDFTMLYSIPITVVFLFFGVPLCSLLYHSENAGKFLVMLAPVIPLMYLDSVADGILKGLDKQTSYLIFNFIDSVVRVVLTYLFVPIYGMIGVVGVIIISELLNTTMSVWKLISVTKIKMNILQSMIIPCVCILTPCLICRLLPQTGSAVFDVIFKITGCTLIYAVTVSAARKKPF